MRQTKVWLAQQAVWDIDDSGRESMPLACGYLKAAALGDPDLQRELDLRIFNFGGADTTLSVIQRMLLPELPDIAAFSIFGWNYNMFGRVTETYRALKPDGWVIFGGTHVTDQAERVFRMFPAVDVIANGEGELTFVELLRAQLAGRSPRELHDIQGISFREADGTIVTTPNRERIQDLDTIPSPFLTGAMDLTREDGSFRYDVVIMETNRGCPHKCAFCFWGGAIGQKVRSFSTERLQEEIDLFGRLGVTNIVLCDANFGMSKHDEAFMDVLIGAREKYGYPREVVTSWAKNKGKPFYNIVRRMKETGFHSSFTLALQSLSDEALELMNRRNMKVNDWKDLAEWLQKEGFDLYAELLWGVPGETCESFIKGYDELATYVTRIATYPHLVLPNTDYSNERDAHGLLTWRAGKDDFEYVLSHNTMTVEENYWMHKFLFWARLVGEYMLLRHIWSPLLKLAGVTQSQVLLSLDEWFDRQSDPISERMRECRALVSDRLDAYAIETGLQFLYEESGLDPLMERWWEEEMIPRVPAAQANFFRELFRYDWLTRPIYRPPDAPGTDANEFWADRLPTVGHEGESYYVRDVGVFGYDIPGVVRNIVKQEPCDFSANPRPVVLYYKMGFRDYIANHEFYPQFVGKTEWQLREDTDKKGLPQRESLSAA